MDPSTSAAATNYVWPAAAGSTTEQVMAMALSPSNTRIRTAAALMTGGVLLLAGCGSDDGLESEGAASPTIQDGTTSSETEGAAPDETTDVESDGATPSATEPETEEQAEEFVITIVDFAYELPDTVPPGATVTVVNEDTAAHTLTSSPAGAFDVNLTGGQSATFTAPEEPGEYGIICLFHGNMTATLVVGSP